VTLTQRGVPGGRPSGLDLRVQAEVAAALADGRPVVALETTLVSHGFSAGRGLAAAKESENRVRAAGAVPATVGVVDGQLRVGLDASELDRFAEAGTDARKVGARDLAACVVQGALGSTTVGGTLAVCRLAGISFMATGGIGGVHRGFATSLDISADLLQIARTRALVVCSGAKSILDVPATSELLETLAVPVLGWRTPTLPLFYTADGGPPVSAVVSSGEEVAKVASTHWGVNPSGGLLLGRPPVDGGLRGRPATPPAHPGQRGGLDLEELIEDAVRQVREAGVTGQAVTPAVLALIEELSDGRSVDVNRRLIADNAGLAAEIAVAYAALD
jgi:pseudouridylate synthase